MDDAPDYYQCSKDSIVQTVTFDLVSHINNFSVVMIYKSFRSQHLMVDFTGSAGAYLARAQIKGINGLSTQTTSIIDTQYNYLNGSGRFSLISKTDAITIVFEDIAATPSYVTISGGVTGGGMAVRRANTSIATSFR